MQFYRLSGGKTHAKCEVGVAITEEEVEAFAEEILDSIPPDVARAIENLAVVVESEPDHEDLVRAGADLGPNHLVLLIRGEDPHPLNMVKPEVGYPVVRPSVVAIYVSSIESEFKDMAGARGPLRKAMLREIGRYLGISAKRLAKLGFE